MGPLGWQETIVIFVLALLLFGPKKLPELGKNLAKAIGEFRRASNELKDTWRREMDSIEKETADIRKEAEELTQVTSDYPDSSPDYNYDSSYDYGAYGYGEGNDAPQFAAGEAAESVEGVEAGSSIGEGVETAGVTPAEGAIPSDAGPAAESGGDASPAPSTEESAPAR